MHHARRVASRWQMQAQVLVACKFGAAHSLVALTSCVHGDCSCCSVAVAAVAAVAAAGLVAPS